MAERPLSKAELDRVGRRLRDDAVARAEDIAAYQQYRATFADGLAEIESVVRTLPVKGSVAARLKRVESTILKLRRSRFPLSGMQDIGGCRLVVRGLVEQDLALAILREKLNCRRVKDYRAESHVSGYSAVHLVVLGSDGRLVEVQLRTRMQHLWAQLSEQVALVPGIGPDIKFGLGPPPVQLQLIALGTYCAAYDDRLGQIDEILNAASSPVIRGTLAARGGLLFDEVDGLWVRIGEAIAELGRLTDNV